VKAWSPLPAPLPLASPGRRGVDRLRLRFGIDADGQLVVEGEDLEESGRIGPIRLGPVR
jgi:hypothetical protein